MPLNVIDKNAFAAEQAAVQQDINRSSAVQFVDAPQRSAIQQLASELMGVGIPRDAAVILSKRVVFAESAIRERQRVLSMDHGGTLTERDALAAASVGKARDS